MQGIPQVPPGIINCVFTSVIFLLDKKVDPEEFLQRIKSIALYFNSLSKDEIKAIKNWIKNTVVKELVDSAIEILEADKMEVELMVARNAYILDEMKEMAKAEGKEVGRAEERKELAIKLLDILDDETISEKTGLDIEKVKELRKFNS